MPKMEIAHRTMQVLWSRTVVKVYGKEAKKQRRRQQQQQQQQQSQQFHKLAFDHAVGT